MPLMSASSPADARFDVIVIGACSAGSPLAMLLARKGYSVLVVDRATFPGRSSRGDDLVLEPDLNRTAVASSPDDHAFGRAVAGEKLVGGRPAMRAAIVRRITFLDPIGVEVCPSSHAGPLPSHAGPLRGRRRSAPP